MYAAVASVQFILQHILNGTTMSREDFLMHYSTIRKLPRQSIDDMVNHLQQHEQLTVMKYVRLKTMFEHYTSFIWDDAHIYQMINPIHLI